MYTMKIDKSVDKMGLFTVYAHVESLRMMLDMATNHPEWLDLEASWWEEGKEYNGISKND